MTLPQHTPVMSEQVLAALNIIPTGIYIDATFGRGGHAAQILAKLATEGRLFALDQDQSAVQAAAKFTADARFSIAHQSFVNLKQFASAQNIQGKVNGILFDIGVCSVQLDKAQRGFSFMQDGPLDMRMNQQQSQTAASWINSASEQEIANVIYNYGEERQSRRIARRIVNARNERQITKTLQLADLVAAVVGRGWQKKHPATRTFQAIRIHINQEIEALKQALNAALGILAPQGRLVVISFHSLEDRLVKHFMREQATTLHQQQVAALPRNMPLPQQAYKTAALQIIGKAQKPTQAEIEQNPRARSAVLRVAQRL